MRRKRDLDAKMVEAIIREREFARSERKRNPARSQQDADRLAMLIEAMKASKRAGGDFMLPINLSDKDRRLVIATALSQLESEQHRIERPTPKRRADMIEYFLTKRGTHIDT